MSQVPNKYTLVTGKEKRNKFSLPHRHLTTTDFFRPQPVVCRETVPNDKMNVDITSFVRLFPMPFPVFGNIRYYNRVFFVPYRQIMEGFSNFITDTDYATGSSYVRIQSVPWFTNSDLCDAFKYNASNPVNLSEPITPGFYLRQYGDYQYMVDETGKIALYTVTGIVKVGFYSDGQNWYWCYNLQDPLRTALQNFGHSDRGTASFTTDVSTIIALTESSTSSYYDFEFTAPSHQGIWFEDEYPAPSIIGDYDHYKFDYEFNGSYYRFTNDGRRFYTLLCSLGYRVDFKNSAGAWTNTQKLSAGKLLAWTKVMLDWYEPSQYALTSSLATLFSGVLPSSGRHIDSTDLTNIASLQFVCYDRDYFTSAWNNPSAPNVADTGVLVDDDTVINNISGANINYRTVARTTSSGVFGSVNGSPTINGVVDNSGSVVGQPTPYNISWYILDQLRALTNYTRRHQLSGFRTVDRYLSQYGIKLSDDRVQRCYYIDGYSYSADIMDIMSTADTPQASLGDYAGKGIAYSDAHRSIDFDCDEFGYLIVVSSVVPEVGYVQGIMRENFHLDRFSFFNADFDNLGTQAIRHDELFADNGLMKIDGSGIATTVLTPDSVFGFTPRYMEYKIGYDFLTGDFNIPSRREGMDAYHLFRLFNDGNINPINKSFLYGEQKQYDRIFNNTDDDYDHMYIVHNCHITAYRAMKSASDVYDFEHAPGDVMQVAANGTQLH